MDEHIRRALAPTADEIRAATTNNNLAVARSLLGEGRDGVLDIGCGEGKFTRGLAGFCRHVGGIDVKERAIRSASEAARAQGVAVDFRVASGEALPFSDASLDVVAFSNSLHHMPRPAVALREALRALKPGGALYVMEPVPAGNYQEATRLVNDETVVRAQALRAVFDLVGESVESVAEIMYRSQRVFADFEEWKADQIDRDEKRRAAFDAQPEKVRDTFVNCARHEDGKLAFDQVFRVNLLRKK